MKSQDITTFYRASSNILKAIANKRNNKKLSYKVIKTIIDDYIAGYIKDYQMSAWLATVASIGMDIDEIESLTKAYVTNKPSIDYSCIGEKIVDKHSTGGVGDKVSFIVVPIVAACGLPVAKISGRGLGHAGGTLDKLESIKGLNLYLNSNELHNILKKTGMVITGQSQDFVPGDKATYCLRDLSGSVDSIPLIAASIMSKKIATGANCLVLDVKTGAGALIPNYNQSIKLAKIMVNLAYKFGISCRAVISDMSQPLGYAIGNTLEIKEAISVLKGNVIPGLTELCFTIARLMLQVADTKLSDIEANTQISHVISKGIAFEKFLKWVNAQGADKKQIINPDLLPSSKYQKTIFADKSGCIQSIDPRIIGNSIYKLRADPQLQNPDFLDCSVGIILHKKVSDKVKKGEPLAEIHYNRDNISKIQNFILSAFKISDTLSPLKPIIHKII